MALWGHHIDFAWVLPFIALLPLPLGYCLANLRGRFNAWTGRDWRSMALGFRHIRQESLASYKLLAPNSEPATHRHWCAQRFITEARDEFEARLLALGRVDELRCRHENIFAKPLEPLSKSRSRGLVLLTPHFDSFMLGIAFAAREGAIVNVLTSGITHHPKVDEAVRAHFFAKYQGTRRYLNGGELHEMERGLRPFYRMLEDSQVLVILADAPPVAGGTSMQVKFLGEARQLAGGAVRLAQKTESDIGGYICRMERPGQYVMQWCEPGPANDPETLKRIYDMFSRTIEERPGL